MNNEPLGGFSSVESLETSAQKLEALEKTDRALAASPDLVEERFRRACLLDQLGRTKEAKAEYSRVLKREPGHFEALSRMGNMLYITASAAAALPYYIQAVTRHPSNPVAYVNLGQLQAQANQKALAKLNYETALRLDPENAAAQRGLAVVLKEFGDKPNAQRYRDMGYRKEPVVYRPYRGEGSPVKVLLLESAMGNLVPLHKHIDGSLFQTTTLFADYFDPSQPLPPHQKVWNLIGDADECSQALEMASRLLEKTSAPVLNHPAKVLPTGREEISKKLSAIPGVITPRISLLSRERLMRPSIGEDLKELGFTFPFLLRSPGFHGGKHFIYAGNGEELRNQLPSLPGDQLLVIEYLDSRSPDGKIRKYRVMMIEGKLYPLHAGLSHDWKIHYFSAEMANHPENREEDLRFLTRMPEVLGPHAMEALGKVCSTLGLDYGGIDFGLNGNGDILLYETNATMVVYPPGPEQIWDYRRPAVQIILDAIQQMFLKS